MSRKAKLPPAPPVESEETRVANFGLHLYELFKKDICPSIFDLQLRYYGDYLHHFGFSIESEVKRYCTSFSSSSTPTRLTTSSPHHNKSVKPSHESPTLLLLLGGEDVVGDAGWGITETEQKEADIQARSMSSLDVALKPEEIVARIVEPYQRVTWRQTITQCSMKKARALYCWICENISVDLTAPNAEEEAAAAAANTSTAKKEDKRKNILPSRGGRKKQVAELNTSITPVEIIDPLVLATQRRTADPLTLAKLYQKFLYHAGVQSEVIEGYIRGRAPGEFIDWAWNIVHIPQESETAKRYLVDVALSSYTGPLRPSARNKDLTPEETTTTAGGGGRDISSSQQQQQQQQQSSKSKRGVPVLEETPKRSIFEGPILAPSHSLQEKYMEDFYFNTHPRQFCPTHLPKEGRHTLLMSPPRKVVWETSICLTHTFFKFPLSLPTQKRRCAFTVRTTPFYITIINEKPEKTELCGVLFKGTLEELPEDYSLTTPLGPQWIWHQREEFSGSETFTMMVPEAGYYSVIIGARNIRNDPYSSVISEEFFIPVIAYQVLVTFVPFQIPQLPRQHFSPSICKLIAPLSHQVPEGLVRFVVMPSCSNVLSIAIILKRPNENSRELLSFLTFSPKCVAYTGEVMLTGGCEAEIWMLYAAPDHNYVNSTDFPRTTPNSLPKLPPIRNDIEINRSESQQEQEPEHNIQGNLSFVPFVTHIEVKKLATAATGVVHIRPQPSIEEEQQLTLRRLIGVTPELYKEATFAAMKRSQTVGSYFASKGILGKKPFGDV